MTTTTSMLTGMFLMPVITSLSTNFASVFIRGISVPRKIVFQPSGQTFYPQYTSTPANITILNGKL